MGAYTAIVKAVAAYRKHKHAKWDNLFRIRTDVSAAFLGQ
jgi:hypothetical protein